MNRLNYVQLYKSESFGSNGGFGIEIKVATTKDMPDLEDNEIFITTDRAVEAIKSSIQEKIKLADPNTLRQSKENERLIEDVFDNPIFVEEIPNEYCNRWYCKHLPWFIVTTKIGRIKIGWRKRVINIDWSDSINQIKAEKLFPNEDVTKFERTIHAWSEVKAKEYINRILELDNN